jgi:prepilin-type processing-associated H-X9-DG protein
MSQPADNPRRIARNTLAAFIAVVVLLVVAGLLLPPVQTDSGRPATRTQCKNNLKQLALALHNYHDAYGCFPPAYVADKSGRPMHSWRVLILPFLEYEPLYRKYRFDEPWNGPLNRELASQQLHLFRCPDDTGPATNTSYLVVVGARTIFPGARSVKISEIEGGTTSTILLVEVVNSGINWTQPRDLSFVEAMRGINPEPALGISSHHKGGAQIAFADGSVRFFPDDTSQDDLRSLLDRDADKPRLPAN